MQVNGPKDLRNTATMRPQELSTVATAIIGQTCSPQSECLPKETGNDHIKWCSTRPLVISFLEEALRWQDDGENRSSLIIILSVDHMWHSVPYVT